MRILLYTDIIFERSEKMDDKLTGGCTGNCHTCGSSCEDEKRGPSFFDRLENISECFSEIGEDNIIQMLNEAVESWEKEDEENNK